MKAQELKKIISESFQIEAELADLARECLKEIFKDKDDLDYVLDQFEYHLENFRDEGCIPSLKGFRCLIEYNQREIQKRKEAKNEKS